MRDAWIPKHSIPLMEYEVECAACSITYRLDSATELKEIYCPFCEDDEPLVVRKVAGESSIANGKKDTAENT